MVRLTATLVLIVTVGGVAWRVAGPRASSSLPPAPGLAPAVILDSRRLDFLEDEGTGRRLADLRVDLERGAGGITVRVVASAIGPRVDAIPGWQGVAAANRITAEEIASILEKNRMRVETDGVADLQPLPGRV